VLYYDLPERSADLEPELLALGYQQLQEVFHLHESAVGFVDDFEACGYMNS
jgi:hypothetical protein